jgi:SAM-dependent methyltransferase
MFKEPCGLFIENGGQELEVTDKRAFADLEKREWADADVARSYAWSFSQASGMVVPYLTEAVCAAPGLDALDLCCGHGNVSAGLVACGATVTGLDSSPAMLDLARTAVPDARVVEGDAMELPFGKAAFDAVTIGFGIPHVPDPLTTLYAARRVLRKGGRIAFSVWCGPEVKGAFDYVFGAIGKHGDPSIVLPPGPGANDYADPDIAFPALEAAGFGAFRCRTIGSLWQVADPGAPFDFFREGTARGGALLRPQPARNADAIRAAVVEQVRQHHGDGPIWTVPIPSVVISAVAK